MKMVLMTKQRFTSFKALYKNIYLYHIAKKHLQEFIKLIYLESNCLADFLGNQLNNYTEECRSLLWHFSYLKIFITLDIFVAQNNIVFKEGGTK